MISLKNFINLKINLIINLTTTLFNNLKNKLLNLIILLKPIKFSDLVQDNKSMKIIGAVFVIIFLFTHVGTYLLNFKFHSTQNFVVAVDKVIKKNVKVKIQASGKIQPQTAIIVKPQIDGVILNAAFTEGQIVQKGQLLFEIDPSQLQALHNQATANLARNQAELQNSQLQLQKYGKLRRNNFVSEQDYQQVIANFKMSEASVEASVAAVESAKVQLDFTKIYSPITGVTGQILVNPGNAIKAATGVGLVNINQTNPVNVLFTIPEEYLPELIRNINNLEDLTVHLSGFSNVGKLIFIDNQVDNLNGTIALKAEFCNCDLALWPGQFVNISLVIKNLTNALIVPSRAIQICQQGAYVYVAEKIKTRKKSYVAKAKKTLVKIGDVIDSETVVISGLQDGQIVITEGQAHLIDNTIVEIYANQ